MEWNRKEESQESCLRVGERAAIVVLKVPFQVIPNVNRKEKIRNKCSNKYCIYPLGKDCNF